MRLLPVVIGGFINEAVGLRYLGRGLSCSREKCTVYGRLNAEVVLL